MLSASSRKITSVIVFKICFLKLILWVIFCEQPDVWDLFLKINKTLLKLGIWRKINTLIFLFLYFIIVYFKFFVSQQPSATKPLECTR